MDSRGLISNGQRFTIFYAEMILFVDRTVHFSRYKENDRVYRKDIVGRICGEQNDLYDPGRSTQA